jgi:hypothetical protein
LEVGQKRVANRFRNHSCPQRGTGVNDHGGDAGGGQRRGGGLFDRGSLYRGIRLLFIGGGLALALWVSVSETMAVWGAFIAIIGLGHLRYWLFVERAQVGGGGSTS